MRANTLMNLGSTLIEATFTFLAKQKAACLEEENALLAEQVAQLLKDGDQLRRNLRAIDLERDEAATELRRVEEERDNALRQLRELTSPA